MHFVRSRQTGIYAVTPTDVTAIGNIRSGMTWVSMASA